MSTCQKIVPGNRHYLVIPFFVSDGQLVEAVTADSPLRNEAIHECEKFVVMKNWLRRMLILIALPFTRRDRFLYAIDRYYGECARKIFSKYRKKEKFALRLNSSMRSEVFTKMTLRDKTYAENKGCHSPGRRSQQFISRSDLSSIH
jgi:hypothetical protein